MNLMEWLKANPSRQILLVLGLCLVLAAGFGAVYLNLLQPRYEVLFSGLRDADAATIVAELDKEKAPYQLKDGGSTILMPADQVAKTRLGLMSTAIPLKGTVGFELFNKSDMGLTEFAQQINYQRALQGELARTIMAMDGVDEARIHMALPEHSIFRDEAKQPKASVTVLTQPGKPLSAGTIRGIQRLVAAAVPDLDVANVVVLDGHGAVVSDAAPIAPSASPQDRKRAAEEAYEGAVRDALQARFPRRRIDVAVWAGAQDPDAFDAAQPSASGAGRSFPLRVDITVSPPSSAAEEQAIRSVVLSAIHADPNRDVVSYRVSEPLAAASPAPGASVARSRPTFDLRSWIIGALLLALLGAFAVPALRQRDGQRLTSRQRTEYAERLKAALDGRRADGPA
jgi:flagellar M-ring protein FliF